ncbi:MAG: STAS domain-containing protein [Chloroflexi bacterium]|nr:STAS domain-containing protein [Chloroflexota bacterium]
MDNLSIELTRDSDAWLLKLKGNVDSSTIHLLWSTDSGASLLKEMSQAHIKKLLIDLTNVEFIDSHGLRVLLNAHKDFSNENIQIVLQNPNPHLKRLLRIMQFDRVFVIESND